MSIMTRPRRKAASFSSEEGCDLYDILCLILFFCAFLMCRAVVAVAGYNIPKSAASVQRGNNEYGGPEWVMENSAGAHDAEKKKNVGKPGTCGSCPRGIRGIKNGVAEIRAGRWYLCHCVLLLSGLEGNAGTQVS